MSVASGKKKTTITYPITFPYRAFINVNHYYGSTNTTINHVLGVVDQFTSYFAVYNTQSSGGTFSFISIGY